MKTKIAISVGDVNGISLELLLKTHKELSKFCEPFYFIHKNLLQQGLKKLGLKAEKLNLVHFEDDLKNELSFKKDKNFTILNYKSKLGMKVSSDFKITPSKIDKKSGLYSFLSFKAASNFTYQGFADALLTLPIHKKAWQEAHIEYKGHTQALSDFFKREAIMMLGCSKLFVGLFTEHIPLKEVSKRISLEPLSKFLTRFALNTGFEKVGVLGFNPHASDFGAIGGEEEKIMKQAIKIANAYLAFKNSSRTKQSEFLSKMELKDKKSLFKKLLEDENLIDELKKLSKYKEIYLKEILVSDSAFTKNSLKRCNRLVCMYHDLGLAALKALYFEKSINVSLNLPIIRTSVDHGTAFDIAYKNAKINTKSYKEAAKMAVKFAQTKKMS
ncbi:4-hydroxythreonine-4-phosphate dehydrogenase [Campylobacter sp. MIT 99-7217]|uniref:4-hydroxythreonine-4-phosphate dehydrogenase n=1 Tax=Campylobacter sp. MIT 99-7217 TaxID=535091 RepID=UPI001159DA8F|nr:4-hydroxythreonine-4-phosphate dehydrogenase [Campylobacter sp. MIT 99-7217]TQR31918.1 4-hydroxythreonine-4-phosphate dehydrogenase [Campylobacter sp. MIT 99-7217]